MPDSTIAFYDHLAPNYHLIFRDWKQSVLWQGATLDAFIRAHISELPLSVLDCSCGIGTQAIGLALRGYQVHATDLSPAAVARGQQEARSFDVSVTWGTADLRTLDRQVGGTFDIVISCDNAVPHLLTDEELLQAARGLRKKLRRDGLVLLSIRDYDQNVIDKPRSTTPLLIEGSGGRRVVFQVWDWSADARTYIVHQFILREADGEWQTTHEATHYRALLRSELSDVLRKAGFMEISWHFPEETGYYQLIVTARKR